MSFLQIENKSAASLIFIVNVYPLQKNESKKKLLRYDEIVKTCLSLFHKGCTEKVNIKVFYCKIIAWWEGSLWFSCGLLYEHMDGLPMDIHRIEVDWCYADCSTAVKTDEQEIRFSWLHYYDRMGVFVDCNCYRVSFRRFHLYSWTTPSLAMNSSNQPWLAPVGP